MNIKQLLKKLPVVVYAYTCFHTHPLVGWVKFRIALLKNKPYFGRHMMALQGNPRRHTYMQRIAIKERVTNVLEVGSWAGGSALVWAGVVKQRNGIVVCVDPWKPYIDLSNNKSLKPMEKALKKDKVFKLFMHNVRTSGNEKTIIPCRGASDDVLPVLGQFDLVYIDGDHSIESVRNDIKNCIPLVRDGGILCGDDLEKQLSEVDLNATSDAAFKGIDYIDGYHPGVTIAVFEELGSVSSWDGFWAVRKNGRSWEPVTLGVTETVRPHSTRPVTATVTEANAA